MDVLDHALKALGGAGKRTGRRLARTARAADAAPSVMISVGTVLASLGVALLLLGGPPAHSSQLASDVTGARLADLGMAAALREHTEALNLPAATTAPEPAPPSLAAAPALRPHEIFGFAPYWTLASSSGFELSGLTTVAYFSVDVNPDGSLDQSGPGWQGYESQALADLIDRAHAAGDRVVLSVTQMDQSALDQLTSSASAPARLSAALVQAVGAKNLDGVNLDFEGEGAGDQAGLTNLVGQVSAALHAANPHYQVTICTYASSAGDPSGFYDIKALDPLVDGFFVMAYQLNLESSPDPASPLTSSDFSDAETFKEYAAAAEPQKVIFGVPYYGEEWTTTDGTMAAAATGGPSTPSYAQIVAGGHPAWWDPVTDTAWTSFEVDGVWHEQFYEDPSSLYLIAQMSQLYGFDGLGIWALGMDGNDPAMMNALLGNAPAVKDALAGPPSGPVPQPAVPTTTTTTTQAAPSTTTIAPTTTTIAPTTTTIAPTTTTTTTTTTPLEYSGLWQGTQVALTPVAAGTPAPSGTPTYVGTLGDFSTDDAAFSCLAPPPGTPAPTTTTTAPASPPEVAGSNVLNVWAFSSSPGLYEVIASQPVDCVSGTFTFPGPVLAGPGAEAGPATTTTTTVSPTTEP